MLRKFIGAIVGALIIAAVRGPPRSCDYDKVPIHTYRNVPIGHFVREQIAVDSQFDEMRCQGIFQRVVVIPFLIEPYPEEPEVPANTTVFDLGFVNVTIPTTTFGIGVVNVTLPTLPVEVVFSNLNLPFNISKVQNASLIPIVAVSSSLLSAVVNVAPCSIFTKVLTVVSLLLSAASGVTYMLVETTDVASLLNNITKVASFVTTVLLTIASACLLHFLQTLTLNIGRRILAWGCMRYRRQAQGIMNLLVVVATFPTKFVSFVGQTLMCSIFVATNIVAYVGFLFTLALATMVILNAPTICAFLVTNEPFLCCVALVVASEAYRRILSSGILESIARAYNRCDMLKGAAYILEQELSLCRFMFKTGFTFYQWSSSVAYPAVLPYVKLAVIIFKICRDVLEVLVPFVIFKVILAVAPILGSAIAIGLSYLPVITIGPSLYKPSTTDRLTKIQSPTYLARLGSFVSIVPQWPEIAIILYLAVVSVRLVYVGPLDYTSSPGETETVFSFCMWMVPGVFLFVWLTNRFINELLEDGRQMRREQHEAWLVWFEEWQQACAGYKIPSPPSPWERCRSVISGLADDLRCEGGFDFDFDLKAGVVVLLLSACLFRVCA